MSSNRTEVMPYGASHQQARNIGDIDFYNDVIANFDSPFSNNIIELLFILSVWLGRHCGTQLCFFVIEHCI